MRMHGSGMKSLDSMENCFIKFKNLITIFVWEELGDMALANRFWRYVFCLCLSSSNQPKATNKEEVKINDK